MMSCREWHVPEVVGLTRTQHARRAQRLPLVCRRWRSVLMGESTAWQTLQLDSRVLSTDSLSSFFAFCSRTRCIEVGEAAIQYAMGVC